MRRDAVGRAGHCDLVLVTGWLADGLPMPKVPAYGIGELFLGLEFENNV
jgi:hypothetical protein